MKLFCGILLLLVNTGLFAQTRTFQQSAGMTISLPWANNYFYYDNNLKKNTSKSGFMGLGLAFFYKRGKNKFSINSGLTSDFPFVVPVPIENVSSSPRSTIRSYFIDAMVHHKFYKHFNSVSGINFEIFQFNSINSNPSYVKREEAFGITIGAEWQFSKNSSFAVLYRPGINPSSDKAYRHIITLDARFDINFWK